MITMAELDLDAIAHRARDVALFAVDRPTKTLGAGDVPALIAEVERLRAAADAVLVPALDSQEAEIARLTAENAAQLQVFGEETKRIEARASGWFRDFESATAEGVRKYAEIRRLQELVGEIRAERDQARALVRVVEPEGQVYIWHTGEKDLYLDPREVDIVVSPDRMTEIESLRAEVAEWRALFDAQRESRTWELPQRASVTVDVANLDAVTADMRMLSDALNREVIARKAFEAERARLRYALLRALGIDDDGRSPLLAYVHTLAAERDAYRAVVDAAQAWRTGLLLHEAEYADDREFTLIDAVDALPPEGPGNGPQIAVEATGGSGDGRG